jgi:o-succinylbenzoate---CoA ligase
MESFPLIEWGASSNQLLINPKVPKEEQNALMQAVNAFEEIHAHFFVATSGSTGRLKWTALSKKAVLVSAKAVNHHLQSDKKDIWLNPLPLFHVAGLGIISRGFLSEAAVIQSVFENDKWNAQHYMEQLIAVKATLTSLVPTQLFDLISHNMSPPPSLRAAIIGGGWVNEILYAKAIEKGWPLLLSYGLTECCSQVATSELGSWEKKEYPLLKPLEHIAIEINEEGYLKIKSQALLTGYLEFLEGRAQFFNPVQNQWFLTSDIAEIKEDKIVSVRREDHWVKIGGESVDLQRLERILEEVQRDLSSAFQLVLLPMLDERMGHLIHLVTDSNSENIKDISLRYNARVLPFERIRKIYTVPNIPRSSLNKLLKNELIQMIQNL